jgi:hypothetical protein
MDLQDFDELAENDKALVLGFRLRCNERTLKAETLEKMLNIIAARSEKDGEWVSKYKGRLVAIGAQRFAQCSMKERYPGIIEIESVDEPIPFLVAKKKSKNHEPIKVRDDIQQTHQMDAIDDFY